MKHEPLALRNYRITTNGGGDIDTITQWLRNGEPYTSGLLFALLLLTIGLLFIIWWVKRKTTVTRLTKYRDAWAAYEEYPLHDVGGLTPNEEKWLVIRLFLEAKSDLQPLIEILSSLEDRAYKKNVRRVHKLQTAINQMVPKTDKLVALLKKHLSELHWTLEEVGVSEATLQQRIAGSVARQGYFDLQGLRAEHLNFEGRMHTITRIFERVRKLDRWQQISGIDLDQIKLDENGCVDIPVKQMLQNLASFAGLPWPPLTVQPDETAAPGLYEAEIQETVKDGAEFVSEHCNAG